MELIKEMHTAVSCYIKQKVRTCPYARLMQLECEILYLKKARDYVQQQYKELTEQIEELKALHFKPRAKRYLDGFCWRGHEDELERLQYRAYSSYRNMEYAKSCPFSKIDCKFESLVKTSMKNFLLEQLMIEIQHYNTLLTVYNAVCDQHHRLGNPSYVFIRFSIENSFSKALYYPMSEKGLVSSMTYKMEYFEKKSQDNKYSKQTLCFKIHADSSSLVNTGLLHLNQQSTIIELCEPLNWLEEGEAFKLKCFYELLKQIRGKSLRDINIYGQLEDLYRSDQVACIAYFKKQGFRILGAFKTDEQFKEECIIYDVL